MSDSAFTLTQPTVIPSALGPLAESHDADAIEADLKAAFMTVFEAMIRPRLARLNTYGMAHRGDFAVIERFVKADGLALDRQGDREPFMRELYRAWRSHNPRRGAAFLRHYLNLLYPGVSSAVQVWQDPAIPYPGGSTEEGPGRFLTSRVRVVIPGAELASDDDLLRLRSIMLSVMPARLVLEMFVTLAQGFESTLRIASAMTIQEMRSFVGDAVTMPPLVVVPTSTAQLSTRSASVAVLSNSNRTFFFPATGFSFEAAWVRSSAARTGKAYFEVLIDSVGPPRAIAIGFMGRTNWNATFLTYDANPFGTPSYVMFSGSGFSSAAGLLTNGVESSNSAYAFVNGSVIGFAVDFATGKVWVRKNGAWITGDPATGVGGTFTLPSGNFDPYLSFYGSAGTPKQQVTFRFVPGDWSSSAPAGFTTLP